MPYWEEKKEKQRKRQERIDFINTLPNPIDWLPQNAVKYEDTEQCEIAGSRGVFHTPLPPNKQYVYKPKAGYLYIVQCKGFPYYKIGQTTQPNGRLNGMQTGCPFELSIEYAQQVRDMNEAERAIHQQYESRRMRGEWFMLTDTELEQVKEDMVIMKDYDYSQSRPGMRCETKEIDCFIRDRGHREGVASGVSKYL